MRFFIGTFSLFSMKYGKRYDVPLFELPSLSGVCDIHTIIAMILETPDSRVFN